MTLREASPLTHENVAMIAGATSQGGAYLGGTYSVREFVELAFAQIGHWIEWRGRVSTKRASTRTAATSSSPLSAVFPADLGRSAAQRSV